MAAGHRRPPYGLSQLRLRAGRHPGFGQPQGRFARPHGAVRAARRSPAIDRGGTVRSLAAHSVRAAPCRPLRRERRSTRVADARPNRHGRRIPLPCRRDHLWWPGVDGMVRPRGADGCRTVEIVRTAGADPAGRGRHGLLRLRAGEDRAGCGAHARLRRPDPHGEQTQMAAHGVRLSRIARFLFQRRRGGVLLPAHGRGPIRRTAVRRLPRRMGRDGAAGREGRRDRRGAVATLSGPAGAGCARPKVGSLARGAARRGGGRRGAARARACGAALPREGGGPRPLVRGRRQGVVRPPPRAGLLPPGPARRLQRGLPRGRGQALRVGVARRAVGGLLRRLDPLGAVRRRRPRRPLPVARYARFVDGRLFARLADAPPQVVPACWRSAGSSSRRSGCGKRIG